MGDNTALYNTIQKQINTSLASIFTALPASIVTYDSSKKTCSVQINLKKTYRSGDVISYPIIHNVPVLFYQTATTLISLPLKKGDQVLLIFCQRSLDEWHNKDGELTPEDSRKFDINDAIAIPGLYRRTTGLEPINDAILLKNNTNIVSIGETITQIQNGVNKIEITSSLTTISNNSNKIEITDSLTTIENGSTKVEILNSGKIAITNSTNELITVLKDLATEIGNLSQEISTSTVGPTGGPLLNASALSVYISKFNVIMSKINSFKK